MISARPGFERGDPPHLPGIIGISRCGDAHRINEMSCIGQHDRAVLMVAGNQQRDLCRFLDLLQEFAVLRHGVSCLADKHTPEWDVFQQFGDLGGRQVLAGRMQKRGNFFLHRHFRESVIHPLMLLVVQKPGNLHIFLTCPFEIIVVDCFCRLLHRIKGCESSIECRKSGCAYNSTIQQLFNCRPAVISAFLSNGYQTVRGRQYQPNGFF